MFLQVTDYLRLFVTFDQNVHLTVFCSKVGVEKYRTSTGEMVVHPTDVPLYLSDENCGKYDLGRPLDC